MAQIKLTKAPPAELDTARLLPRLRGRARTAPRIEARTSAERQLERLERDTAGRP